MSKSVLGGVVSQCCVAFLLAMIATVGRQSVQGGVDVIFRRRAL